VDGEPGLSKIFITFFKVGSFTFGGGYAMLPIVREELVDRNRWFEEEDFLDLLAASQSVPGPLVVNASLLIGYRMCGYRGAAAALLGSVLPSFFIMLVLATFFLQLQEQPLVQAIFSGIRPAVAALIAAAALKMGKPLFKKRGSLLLVVLLSFLAIVLDIHPMAVILAGAILGLLLYSRGGREGGKENADS